MYQLHKTVYLFPNDTKSEKVMRKFYEISLITSISAGPYRVVLFPNESIIVCPFKFNWDAIFSNFSLIISLSPLIILPASALKKFMVTIRENIDFIYFWLNEKFDNFWIYGNTHGPYLPYISVVLSIGNTDVAISLYPLKSIEKIIMDWTFPALPISAKRGKWSPGTLHSIKDIKP